MVHPCTPERLREAEFTDKVECSDVRLGDVELDLLTGDASQQVANDPAPEFAGVRENRTEAIPDLGRPEDARRHYEAALASRPGHVEAHNNLGALLAGPLRRPSEARSHYEAALALRPGHLGARINLAVLLADQLGQPQVALAQYAEVLRLQPGHREARYNLGALYANHLDRPDLARAEFEAVLRLDPGYEPARAALRLLGP